MSYHRIHEASKNMSSMGLSLCVHGVQGVVEVPYQYQRDHKLEGDLGFLRGCYVQLSEDGTFDSIITSIEYNHRLEAEVEAEAEVAKVEKRAKDHVLMGTENPDGWKLEELLVKLQFEVGNKSAKIEKDTRLEAKTVLHHNMQIIGLLQQAEALQRQSYAILDAMAPNEGPLGTPRIGEDKK